MWQVQAPFPPTVVVDTGSAPMEPAAIVFIVIAALVAVTLILWPLARALARRLEGKGGADQALRAEIEDLHARVQQLDAGQARIQELEERLDFTERVLAQRQERPAIAERP